jgi:hypothetical protein
MGWTFSSPGEGKKLTEFSWPDLLKKDHCKAGHRHSRAITWNIDRQTSYYIYTSLNSHQIGSIKSKTVHSYYVAAIPPFPQYVFMVRYLVAHKDNFIFTWLEWLKYYCARIYNFSLVSVQKGGPLQRTLINVFHSSPGMSGY